MYVLRRLRYVYMCARYACSRCNIQQQCNILPLDSAVLRLCRRSLLLPSLLHSVFLLGFRGLVVIFLLMTNLQVYVAWIRANGNLHCLRGKLYSGYLTAYLICDFLPLPNDWSLAWLVYLWPRTINRQTNIWHEQHQSLLIPPGTMLADQYDQYSCMMIVFTSVEGGKFREYSSPFYRYWSWSQRQSRIVRKNWKRRSRVSGRFLAGLVWGGLRVILVRSGVSSETPYSYYLQRLRVEHSGMFLPASR